MSTSTLTFAGASAPPTPATVLAWAAAPLAGLSAAERLAFAVVMASGMSPKISRPASDTLMRHRAIHTYWTAVARADRIRLRVNTSKDRTDDHLAVLHHERIAASALTAIPGITLAQLYEVAVDLLNDVADESTLHDVVSADLTIASLDDPSPLDASLTFDLSDDPSDTPHPLSEPQIIKGFPSAEGDLPLFHDDVDFEEFRDTGIANRVNANSNRVKKFPIKTKAVDRLDVVNPKNTPTKFNAKRGRKRDTTPAITLPASASGTGSTVKRDTPAGVSGHSRRRR